MVPTWPAYRDPDAVRQWAADLFDRAHSTGPIPELGSPAWCDLDDRDPRKPAGVVRAALAWLHESDPEVIAARLRTELDLMDQIFSEREKHVSWDLCAAADWSRIASGPTQRELNRRRSLYLCPHCRTSLHYRDTRCPDCGWIEATPEQQRATARQSWARFDIPDTSKEVAA